MNSLLGECGKPKLVTLNARSKQQIWVLYVQNYLCQKIVADNGQEASGFVLALIDGDGAIFHDYLYKAGSDGGADAAQELHDQIRAHVAECYPDRNTSGYDIMVQIFYNMEGLSHKLKSLGIFKNPNEMAPFARAFSLNKSLFSFIDVGSGKERADHKVRETLRLFLPNMQCKHVIFGGCHDNGYLPTLDPYKRDQNTAPRISLLETLPIQPGFTQLGFKVVQFPTVFRSEPLPDKSAIPAFFSPVVQNTAATQSTSALSSRSNSFATGGASVNTAPTPVQAVTSNAVQAATSNPSGDSSWATVGKNAPKTINIAAKKAPARKFILLNAYDERLDSILPKADQAATTRFTERVRTKKVCNNYHLNGKCKAGKYCDYDHGERLSPGEQLVLKHRARTRSCPDRGDCRDFDCTDGHVCPYGKDCYNDNCWFQEVHDVDTKVVSRIFESGEQEWNMK
ncbi:hypothetical protein E4T38_05446 [Aureobasidium subglaciale]|nr:hypothetical protein E4T38_05446 [Aureobasidium subglaciale]KAI5221535.1 hypothetical protein E4T40_05420 [Aureobasidium subglaciale]KAI5225563.1 hypothetical protein E4T41_05198 [Aureobasidium subglaciale]KAI5261501.1 hypothetical protein E4T46_05131 [Aureobasidium subglaciale]